MSEPKESLPSRLERFKKTFPEHEKRIKALRRMVSSLPDSERDAEGHRTRYRPLSFAEMRRVLRNREQNGDTEVERRMREQEASLNEWISGLDEEYSDKKYTFLIHQIIAPQILGVRDSIGDQPFERRTPETYAPYPRLNREALARVMDKLVKISEGRKAGKMDFIREYEKELHHVEKIAREQVARRFEGIPQKWKIYRGQKGARELEKDLRDKGTGWCIAGYESAYGTYLTRRDSLMHVCFRGGNNAAAAIYVAEGNIREIRGSAPGQHMDGDAANRAKDYIRANLSAGNDLTDLDQKFDYVLTLTDIIDGGLESAERSKDAARQKALLSFLYELERPIKGFGYKKDSRIAELRAKRDSEADIPIVFNCRSKEIARDSRKIDQNTKAYIGRLVPGIFQRIAHVKYLYVSFPEGRIVRREIEIGGIGKERLKQTIREHFQLSDHAESMINNLDFTTLHMARRIDLIELAVRDLGFDHGNPTTDQIYRRAEELGLELCPAEVGPHLRLQHLKQSLGELPFIGMKQIPRRDGRLSIFRVGYTVDGLWLGDGGALPDSRWNLDSRIIFCLRRSS